MTDAGRAVRLLPIETLKAGGPMEPCKGPDSVLRREEGAAPTTRRKGAAVGCAPAAARSSNIGWPAVRARR